MTDLLVTPQAQRDIEQAIANLGLLTDTWMRIARSLRVLEAFPLAGRALEGRWAGTRFLLGPWPWMILLYRYDEAKDKVFIVAVEDARCSAAATGNR